MTVNVRLEMPLNSRKIAKRSKWSPKKWHSGSEQKSQVQWFSPITNISVGYSNRLNSFFSHLKEDFIPKKNAKKLCDCNTYKSFIFLQSKLHALASPHTFPGFHTFPVSYIQLKNFSYSYNETIITPIGRQCTESGHLNKHWTVSKLRNYSTNESGSLG